MSDKPSRRLRPKDAAMFAKTGGEFAEEDRFVAAKDGEFVPWGKTSFKVVAEDELTDSTDETEEEAVEPVPEEPSTESIQQAADEAAAAAALQAAQEHAQQVAFVPPPLIQETPLNSADIIAEIEKAREDGRAIGYQQGVTAARHELADALAAIRRLEEQLVPAAEEVLEKNTAVIARHVRRIAQDLAGNVFATIPEMFIERIRKSADMFTRAGSEFTLAINSKDAQSLMPALRGEDMFKTIKIIEDSNLPNGGFRLTGRDLEVEDVPELLGLAEEAP
jgi:flagellar biosynthesis/type III secretory pathway protein FliH